MCNEKEINFVYCSDGRIRNVSDYNDSMCKIG